MEWKCTTIAFRQTKTDLAIDDTAGDPIRVGDLWDTVRTGNKRFEQDRLSLVAVVVG